MFYKIIMRNLSCDGERNKLENSSALLTALMAVDDGNVEFMAREKIKLIAKPFSSLQS